MKSINRVETMRPPQMVIERGFHNCWDSPFPKSRGARPRMVVRVVINMGRIRTSPALSRARKTVHFFLQMVEDIHKNDGIADGDAAKHDESYHGSEGDGCMGDVEQRDGTEDSEGHSGENDDGLPV